MWAAGIVASKLSVEFPLTGIKPLYSLAGNTLRNQIGLKSLTICLGFTRVKSVAQDDHSLEAS